MACWTEALIGRGVEDSATEAAEADSLAETGGARVFAEYALPSGQVREVVGRAGSAGAVGPLIIIVSETKTASCLENEACRDALGA